MILVLTLFPLTLIKVSVCAGCNVFEPAVSLIVGGISGILYVLLDKTLLRLQIDDPINASPGRLIRIKLLLNVIVSQNLIECFVLVVHLGVGLWGVIACPLFDKNEGVFYTGSIRSLKFLGWNALGGISITAWTCFWCGLIFLVLRRLKQLRVPQEIEIKGMCPISNN